MEVIRCAVMTTMRFSGDLLSSCFDVVVVANARKKRPAAAAYLRDRVASRARGRRLACTAFRQMRH